MYNIRSLRVKIELTYVGGPDNVVGIATVYGMDRPGVEFQWGGEFFRILPDRPCGPPSPASFSRC